MVSNSRRTKVQALMGMALRGRWSKEERKEDREGERPPSSIILLIREIRVGESIRPKIKSSLFHSDRDGSWRKSLLGSRTSLPLRLLYSPRPERHRAAITDRPFDSLL